ncbi:sensor histidine kinase [Myxococcus sp. CA033]|uniref:sensor histidine kinase n=1 Tax=Myxococcus sp. CA033 TaxID=2741516 RepID=UPI00157BAB32|nr:sensor histidine kinase [Myxococcus sp. CA033]NTX38594.1 sensor histidine kinase [Myxococcus sp. CA033]
MSAARDWVGRTSGEAGDGVGHPARAPRLESVEGPDFHQVDVAALMRESMELLEAARRIHGIAVNLELPDEAVLARTGLRRTRQVLLLLLAHAADLAGESGVRVSLDPPDDFGDVGPRFQVVTPDAHLSERELRAVFLSPMLVGPTHRRLARARELVESVGGTLDVVRGAESGLTVTVELPAPGLACW